MESGRGKFIIGLTGNIATGKSVVRRMLEQLGAYTIDADELAHRAIRKGAPGYDAVLETFGSWILDARGEIDRSRLGRLAFQDADALARLEAIVHPLVRQAVDLLVPRSRREVIVVEAIKLLEGELRRRCNSIWVTDSPPAVQIERLMAYRQMSREQAAERVASQGPQSEKIAQADVVIRNSGSYDDLWHQVQQAWQELRAGASSETSTQSQSDGGKLGIKMGQPEDATAIAECLSRLGSSDFRATASDVLAEFGQKAYVLLVQDSHLAGIAGWQVDNLLVRTTDLYLESSVDVEQGLGMLLHEVEELSSDLQCEASLVLAGKSLALETAIWEKLGYRPCTVEELAEEPWMDAESESAPVDAALWLKDLRFDRARRPI